MDQCSEYHDIVVNNFMCNNECQTVKFLLGSCVRIASGTEQEKVSSFCNYARDNYRLFFSLHGFLIDMAKSIESKKDKWLVFSIYKKIFSKKI